MKYNRSLMNAILKDKVQIAKAVNVQVGKFCTSPILHHLFQCIFHRRRFTLNPKKMNFDRSPQVLSLDDAPKGYKDFDKGAAVKYVLDPHGSIKK